MQSISVLLDITKIANFRWKKKRTQWHVSSDLFIFWILFRKGVTAKFHHDRISVTDFRERVLFEQTRKGPSWIGLIFRCFKKHCFTIIFIFKRGFNTGVSCRYCTIFKKTYFEKLPLWLLRMFVTRFFFISNQVAKDLTLKMT